MIKNIKEVSERLVIKLPKSVAEYFRKSFAHGDRSKFIADCILKHKRDQETRKMEEELRRSGTKRQKFFL
ncbi:MAG: hypothetical protein ABH832_01350 [bacterium]